MLDVNELRRRYDVVCFRCGGRKYLGEPHRQTVEVNHRNIACLIVLRNHLYDTGGCPRTPLRVAQPLALPLVVEVQHGAEAPDADPPSLWSGQARVERAFRALLGPPENRPPLRRAMLQHEGEPDGSYQPPSGRLSAHHIH